MNDNIKMWMQRAKIIHTIPVILTAIIFLVSLILLLNGNSYFVFLNMVSIVALVLSIMYMVRYNKALEYVRRVFNRENPKEALEEMLKNVTAPSEKESHMGMSDDYYNQTSRFGGIIGDPQIGIMKKVLSLM